MDLLDVAILALRLALVLVLYLFLAMVVRLAARSLKAAPSARGSEPARRPAPSPTRTVVSTRQAARGALRLVVVEPGASGLAAGGVVDVPDGATLGRAERASVVLADPAVSGEHARVSRSGSRWIVTDLGSTNGTLVNDARVEDSGALEPGDVLALGAVRLQVVGS